LLRSIHYAALHMACAASMPAVESEYWLIARQDAANFAVNTHSRAREPTLECRSNYQLEQSSVFPNSFVVRFLRSSNVRGDAQ
jgi:hypothetical protein